MFWEKQGYICILIKYLVLTGDFQIKGNKKIIRAWILYDWSNSAYQLTVLSVVFPVFYEKITSSEGNNIVSFWIWNYKFSIVFMGNSDFIFYCGNMLTFIVCNCWYYRQKKRIYAFLLSLVLFRVACCISLIPQILN